MKDYEVVIGLEVHAQLSTKTKAFCACEIREGLNDSICPICTGQPGTLPKLNETVVDYAVLLGLALGSTVHQKSAFARKHYFYPDLPKGYQITQYKYPICTEGQLNIRLKDQEKIIRIERIHIEEDAGKNLHLEQFSAVNLNRAGVPLLEIVSRPDMRA